MTADREIARIRLATPDDAPALAGMHIASWHETYTGLLPDKILSSLVVESRAAAWAKIMQEPATEHSTVIYLAEHQETIIGFGSCGAQRTDALKATGGPALRGMVDSPYGTIPFTCATTAFYMTHHGYKRERQMPALNEFARGRNKIDFPAILVGDFNTDPESAEIRYLNGLQSLEGGSAYWCDAWNHAGDGSKGTTWSKSNDFAAWAPWPDRRIDYIFVAQPRLDGADTIEHCSVVCNERAGDIWPSDHFGVLARVKRS